MITLGLVAKDESKYLKEWILYHKLIGIDNFSIYLHNNTDNSKDILQNLSLSIDVEYVNTKEINEKIKNNLYSNIINSANTEFVCCLDIDEFIVLPGHNNIKDFLSSSLYDDFGGIALHQNIFGSSGHIRSPKGLVIENYTMRHPDNIDISKNYPNFQNPQDLLKIVKIIIRKKNFLKIFGGHEYISTNTPIVDENGELYRKYTCRRSVAKIRLNHYFTKSLGDWTFKTNRPRFSGCPKYPNAWFDYFSSFDYKDDYLNTKYSSKIKESL